jgi:cytosine/adenosine deaminase-related metal-dependent hydrolase
VQVPSADPPSAIAVVGVNVVPMDGERVIPRQTVLVRGDRIVAVGMTDDVAVPNGALRIDGSGQYIVPGLVDAHVHLSRTMSWAPARPDFGDGPLYLANGVTTVINLGGSPEQLEWRRRVAAGALIGPTIYTSGEFINEPRMATPQQIEDAVRAQKAAGYDLVKYRERPNTTVGLSQAAYRRLIDVAKEVDLPLVGHAPVNLGLDALLEAGQPLAHMNTLSNLYFSNRSTNTV